MLSKSVKIHKLTCFAYVIWYWWVFPAMVLWPQTFFFSTSHFALTQIPAALPPCANALLFLNSHPDCFEGTHWTLSSIHKDCVESQTVDNCVKYVMVENMSCVSVGTSWRLNVLKNGLWTVQRRSGTQGSVEKQRCGGWTVINKHDSKRENSPWRCCRDLWMCIFSCSLKVLQSKWMCFRSEVITTHFSIDLHLLLSCKTQNLSTPLGIRQQSSAVYKHSPCKELYCSCTSGDGWEGLVYQAVSV